MSDGVKGRIRESVDGLRNRDRITDERRLRESKSKVAKEDEERRRKNKSGPKRGNGGR